MKAARAYKALHQEEKLLLSHTAESVAILVENARARDHFRKQLQEYAKKWHAFKAASEARRKGTWKPEMGQPENPLDAIWPRASPQPWLQSRHGVFRVPSFGSKPILGAYAMLAIIHDQVLPQCPSLATGILSEELARTVWRDLVTGANEEGNGVFSDETSYPRWVIPTSKIEAFLQDVKADIESHLAPTKVEQRQPASGGDAKDDDTANEPPERYRLAFGALQRVYEERADLVPDSEDRRPRYTQQMHAWARDNCDGVPQDYNTWKRYIREYRRLAGAPTNDATRGRTGRSVISQDNL